MPCPDVSPISCADLLASFAELPDPRRRRGVRHQVQAILAIAAAAVVAGARSFTAIGEWADEAPQQVLAALGARLDPDTGAYVAPHEATLRRTIQAFDPRHQRPSPGRSQQHRRSPTLGRPRHHQAPDHLRNQHVTGLCQSPDLLGVRSGAPFRRFRSCEQRMHMLTLLERGITDGGGT